MSRQDLWARRAAIVLAGQSEMMFLYNLGDERTDLTGGWGNDYYINTGYTRVNMTKASTYMRAYYAPATSAREVSFGPSNAINLTNYKKLVYDIDVIVSPRNINVFTGTSKSGSTWTSIIGLGTASTGRQLVVIDISAITGSYYLRASVRNVNDGPTWAADVSFHSVWLEK